MKKKLLVVDDSVFIWDEIRHIVEDTDYEVVGCSKSGEQAIGFYEEMKPDLVTMDIILPGIDGIQTAKTILEKWPEAKIIMLSSLAYDDTIEEAKKIGASGFLFKPFEQDAVLSEFQKVLG